MKKAKKAVRKTKTAPKKVTAKKKTSRAQSAALAESLYMGTGFDPAHAEGHKKMNLRSQFKKTGHKNEAQNSHAFNQMSAASKIKRTSATNRRIITGAAVGKTGQIIIK